LLTIHGSAKGTVFKPPRMMAKAAFPAIELVKQTFFEILQHREVSGMKREQKRERLDHRKHEPTVAPGLDLDEVQRPATKDEIERGDTTMVYRLSFDENDNGSDE
jgi:hypothetical protein